LRDGMRVGSLVDAGELPLTSLFLSLSAQRLARGNWDDLGPVAPLLPSSRKKIIQMPVS
jgi:hypothetical protein